MLRAPLPSGRARRAPVATGAWLLSMGPTGSADGRVRLIDGSRNSLVTMSSAVRPAFGAWPRAGVHRDRRRDQVVDPGDVERADHAVGAVADEAVVEHRLDGVVGHTLAVDPAVVELLRPASRMIVLVFAGSLR